MIFDTSRFVTLFFVGASVAFFTICTIARSRTSGSLSLINGRQALSLRISAALAEHSSPPLHIVDNERGVGTSPNPPIVKNPGDFGTHGSRTAIYRFNRKIPRHFTRHKIIAIPGWLSSLVRRG